MSQESYKEQRSFYMYDMKAKAVHHSFLRALLNKYVNLFWKYQLRGTLMQIRHSP